jgi:hypothetical protein
VLEGGGLAGARRAADVQALLDGGLLFEHC